MSGGSVRALVVDDSTTARTLLVAILDADPDIEVVGQAATGEEAVEQVRAHRPSVVVMDIEMPVLDGFEASKRIMAEIPTPIVIVTAHVDPRDVAVCLEATRVGALTVQRKPRVPTSARFAWETTRLVSLVKALADVKVVGQRVNRVSRAAPVPPVSRGRQLRIAGVAASTGGPAALYRFLGALPGNLGIPVLVVQHIAEGFVSGLVRWLSSGTPLPVKVAEHGETLSPATVYVAPDGAHLVVDGKRRGFLDDGPPVRGFRPSASALLTSLAAGFGRSAAGVVLTGMGRDGLDGARALHDRTGLVLAQDEQTSSVFGMPRAVAEAGLADIVGSVEELALTIEALVPTPDGRRERGQS